MKSQIKENKKTLNDLKSKFEISEKSDWSPARVRIRAVTDDGHARGCGLRMFYVAHALTQAGAHHEPRISLGYYQNLAAKR